MLKGKVAMDPSPVQPFIFLSYSMQDRDIANRLAADLKRQGMRSWTDQEIRVGENQHLFNLLFSCQMEARSFI